MPNRKSKIVVQTEGVSEAVKLGGDHLQSVVPTEVVPETLKSVGDQLKRKSEGNHLLIQSVDTI